MERSLGLGKTLGFVAKWMNLLSIWLFRDNELVASLLDSSEEENGRHKEKGKIDHTKEAQLAHQKMSECHGHYEQCEYLGEHSKHSCISRTFLLKFWAKTLISPQRARKYRSILENSPRKWPSVNSPALLSWRTCP